jgi:hypothetical protein
MCALSDTDRHSILNVPSRVLERLVSIAVANAEGVEGLTAPGPAKTSLDAAISTARHEKDVAAKKLENLLTVAESGKAPMSILKRITETETLLESLSAKYESAKMAANFSRVKPNKRDLTDLLLSAQSEKIFPKP